MVRIASAVLLIALVAGTIWWLPWWATLVLAVAVAAIGGRELAGLASHAGTPARPHAQYWAKGRIQRARSNSPGKTRLSQNSWRPSVRPAGSIGQWHSSNQGAIAA